MILRRIEIRAVRAPEALDGIKASAKYIARLTIDNKPVSYTHLTLPTIA